MRENHKRPGAGVIALLTTLLIVCGLVEAGIASYVGINVQSAWQANLELKAQQVAIEAERERMEANPPAIQYVGPGAQVTDGNLIRGEWEPTDPVESSSVTARYSPPPVPKYAVEKSVPNVEYKKPPEIPKADIPKVETPSASTPSASKPADPPKTNSGSSSGSSSNSSGNSSGGVAVNPSDGAATESKPAASNAATVQNADGTYKHDFSGGRVLGTVNSDKYHNSDCIGARKIPPENEIWYSSVADAVAAGRDPCGNCYR